MWWTKAIAILAIAYFIGGIPFGYIFVKLKTGRDVRAIQSGRTGTTNAMRAAGALVGVLTVVMDITKGYVAVWLAREIFPFKPWLHVLAGLLMIIGHNYPLVMVEREEGRPRSKGGREGRSERGRGNGLMVAGCLHSSADRRTFPVGGWLRLGCHNEYARNCHRGVCLLGFSRPAPWAYVWYGLLAEVLLLWALWPNIKRLIAGNERIGGLRAWLKKALLNSPLHIYLPLFAA